MDEIFQLTLSVAGRFLAFGEIVVGIYIFFFRVGRLLFSMRHTMHIKH